MRKRRYRHDEYVAVDLFSGFGGLTQGIEQAGFTTIMAANHNEYKVDVHEANHPHAEHWIADLVDPDSSDYHSARDLPPGDLLAAGVSCVNHSPANTQRAYSTGASLFDLDDPEYEARVTRSERDRATANCVLHYAQTHHPRLILVECTTELASWGPRIPGRKKVGDGSTYRWWLNQFELLDYRYRVLYLNSIERLIVRYSNEGDTVFDPFAGIMTVPYCAVKLGRFGIGVELNAVYWRDGLVHLQAEERKQSMPSLFTELEAAA